MKVLVPEHSGFCPGVKNAENLIFREKQKRTGKNLYVLGYMINNHSYIAYLSRNSILTVNSLDEVEKDSIVAIRTHGCDRHLEKKIREKFEVLDLTCRNVKRVQLKIWEHAEAGYFILITGKKIHPEIQGLKSYARNHYVIEREDDLTEFIEKFADNSKKIYIVSQTTGSQELFKKTLGEIQRAFGPTHTIEFYDSICPITARKEREALKLQEQVQITLVIGDRLSSNASKLFKILSENNGETHFFQDLGEMQKSGIEWADIEAAQVVSSASTPDFVEEEVIQFLSTQ
jgi:4-hydroxy-3-methylbut-2-en-1-yl diphosphate reductase